MRTQVIHELIEEVTALRWDLMELEREGLAQASPIHPSYRDSARNLLHYLALRGRDIRKLQERLATLGLSSLGRSEAHVLASVNAVLEVLHRLANSPQPTLADSALSLEGTAGRAGGRDAPVEYLAGKRLLNRHTEALLGPRPEDRNTRIMVTLPTEVADDPELPRALLAAGMNCARINCAHDDASIWERMIAHLRAAERELGKPCKLFMDLAGPKLRTGPVRFSAQVLKWRPLRDEYGRVSAPARIRLVPHGRTTESRLRTPELAVPADWLVKMQVGDRIDFVDARGARRFLIIVSDDGEGRWAETVRTAYVTPETILRWQSHDESTGGERESAVAVGVLPPKEQSLVLRRGDTLLLTRQLDSASPAVGSSSSGSPGRARIGCTLPEVFGDLRPGERIWFDDGKIGGVIEAVQFDEIQIRITDAAASGAKLRGDKGINLPDSSLSLPALTAKDLADLPFVAAHADLVGHSFVRSAADVVELDDRLREHGGQGLGIVLKIETRRAFEELPSLLLSAMRSPCDGVMIARGDLAIECGYERLAEVQEQILWVCEAAHVPVIWATQVLESLAKGGRPSRAEISDAAIGQRAECVMLNKGPHVVQAVQSLADILRRMEAHQSKKQSTLRPLDLARRFLHSHFLQSQAKTN